MTFPTRPRFGQPLPEYEPTYTLDWHIARARKEMGEAVWLELQREWEVGEQFDRAIASLQQETGK